MPAKYQAMTRCVAILGTVVLVALGLSGCQQIKLQKPSQAATVTGILVSQAQNCAPKIASCSVSYKLYQQDMRHWIALTGPVDTSLQHYLLRVRGDWVNTQQQILQVEGVTPLSNMPYHQFLVEAADRYTASRYPCRLSWDKSFGWQMDQDQARFTVRLTQFAGQPNSPALLLRFNVQTGQLLTAEERNWQLPLCTKSDV